MKVSIFGLGYVGSVSLACFAKLGHQVVGVDVEKSKVDLINQGKSPVIEPGLNDLVSEQHRLGRIAASDNGMGAVKGSDISFICVGTPSDEKGHLDLTAVHGVAEEIAKGVKEREGFHVVAIRSTVQPGTNDRVRSIIERVSGKRYGEAFSVVSNPEFLREGSAIKDFQTAPLTLVGARPGDRGAEVLKAVYAGIDSPIVFADVNVGEMIKYVNNAFHALKITFANEIGNICKRMGIDSHRLMEIFCMDRKLNLSPYYFKPGFAYGGSCLPKDLRGLKMLAHDAYLECPVLESIEESNDLQKKIVIDGVMRFQKEKVGFLGLSFKAGTDDLRNSPIVDVMELLLGKGFDIKVYDKNVSLSKLVGKNREYILKKIPFVSKFLTDDLDKVLDHSDVLVVVNNEDGFEEILDRLPEEKVIFDLVNIPFRTRGTRGNYVGLAW